MNRIERLTAILMLLQDKPRSATEIARHFEVSKRTILRDVQALCEMGVPVIAQDGARGGYSLPPHPWASAYYRSRQAKSPQPLLPPKREEPRGPWYCQAPSAEPGESRRSRVDPLPPLGPVEEGFVPPPARPAPAYDDPAHPEVR